MTARSTIAVDVGNSAVKLGMMIPDAIDATESENPRSSSSAASSGSETSARPVDGSETEFSGSLTLSRVGLDEEDWTGLVRRAVQVWRAEMNLDEPLPWVIASVNRQASSKLQAVVQAQWPEDHWLALDAQHLPIDTSVENRSAVGIDRLLGAIGALSMGDADNVIVVDAGSAVTIDLVMDRCFAGGAIVPGVKLQFDALNQGTDQLPALNNYADFTKGMVETRLELPGRNTREAMRAGVLIGLAGSIDRLIFQFSELCGSTPQIVFTGGDGQVLSELVKHKSRVHEDLVITTILSVAHHLEVD